MTIGGPLDGVRVVDLTDELGAYCGRLLRDLGADVIHVAAADADADDPVRLFRSIGKTRVARGNGATFDAASVADLLEGATIVLTDGGPAALRARGLHPDETTARDPGLIHVSITPYGLTGPDADVIATDLTLIAAGGLLYIAGDPDRPPVRPYGEQSAVAASLHATIAALIALDVRETIGEGQVVDVSAQEAVAQATENAVQYLDCEQIVRRRAGAGPREAGGGLFRCADGYVYLLATMGGLDLSLGRVAEWLEANGIEAAAELRRPEWSTGAFRNRPEAIDRFTEIFESFSLEQRKLDLYTSGQARNISIAPVSAAGDLVASPQLTARSFFRSREIAGRKLQIPGPPYRFAAGGVGPREVASLRVLPRSSVPSTANRHRRQPVGPVQGPLRGVRIADFTWVGAGPFLTKPFGDHGADVIKIESRAHTDPIRSMRPFRDGVPGLDRSGYFANRNSSKRSICLDLKDPRGLDLARRLIAQSDVIANNFSAGTMAALGLGYDEVRKFNPGIVYLDMPMQGADGPHSGYRGFGLTIGALGGFLDSTGWPDRPPLGTGTNFPDHVPNPLHGAIAVLAALRKRRVTGEGEYIELSQLESTVNAIGPAVLESQLTGVASVRRGNADPRFLVHGVFPAAGNDRWIALAVRDSAQLKGLHSVLDGLPVDGSPAILDDAIARATSTRDRMELVSALRRAGIFVSPVNDSADLLADPQLGARGHWVTLDHPEMGPSVYDAPPYRLSRTPGGLRSPAPLLGADTRDVCVDLLGLSTQDYEKWRDEGIIG